jgi:hypothetical protein
MLYQMPLLEGITLGFLMNSKGLVEMIVLNVGREQKVTTFKNFFPFVLQVFPPLMFM